MFEDLAFAWRALRRRPGLWLAGGLAVALGVGLNAAVFHEIDQRLWSPLPFPEADRLVRVEGVDKAGTGETTAISPADFFDLHARADSFSAFAAHTGSLIHVALGDDGSRRMSGTVATCELFEVLGVSPVAGRLFTADDCRGGAESVVVLSEDLYRRAFGGDPAAIGDTIEISGQESRIVGVAPRSANRLRSGDLWVPMAVEPAEATRRARYLGAIGRLRPDLQASTAAAEMTKLADELAERFPETHADLGLAVSDLRSALGSSSKDALGVLAGLALCVLGLASIDVALLVVSRLDARRDELIVRGALGASRFRILRQLVLEIAILASAGALVGWLSALAGHEILLRLLPPRVEGGGLFDLALYVALSCAALTLMVAAAVGWWLRKQSLARGGRSALGSHGGLGGSLGLQNAMVVAQVAVACWLLVGAGLMLRTLRSLADVDPGFDPRGVLTVSLVFPSRGYPPNSPELETYLDQAREVAAALPGVESVATGIVQPMGGMVSRQVEVEGSGDGPEATAQKAVSAGYFDTLRLTLVRGRAYAESERRAALVDERFVAERLAGQDPLGRWIRVSSPMREEAERLEIVGVVRSEKLLGLDEEPRPTVYLPHDLELMPFATLAVRSGTATLGPALREALVALDRGVAVEEPVALASAVADSVSDQRALARLLDLFALVAFCVAVLGIHGVTSLAVTRRLRELGLRLSLGATPGDLWKTVLAGSLRLGIAGVVVGTLAAAWSGRWLESQLFGVDAADPTTLTVVAGLLLAGCLVAGTWPARRAGQLQPSDVLRAE